jgi:putative membrane protein
MLVVKSLHIIFMVTWFAGLFYLPRLFVYHAMSTDETSIERFKVMERKLYYGITWPGGLLTVVFGLWIWLGWYDTTPLWLWIKIGLVSLLVTYHFWCGVLVKAFKENRNVKSHVWYRWFNEAPVLILFVVVFLVVLKPQF